MANSDALTTCSKTVTVSGNTLVLAVSNHLQYRIQSDLPTLTPPAPAIAAEADHPHRAPAPTDAPAQSSPPGHKPHRLPCNPARCRLRGAYAVPSGAFCASIRLCWFRRRSRATCPNNFRRSPGSSFANNAPAHSSSTSSSSLISHPTSPVTHLSHTAPATAT